MPHLIRDHQNRHLRLTDERLERIVRQHPEVARLGALAIEDAGEVFGNLIRASILYFIALQDRRRTEVLDILDRSQSEPSEITGLRRSANEYWGLSGHEDEMLCAGRWQV